MVYIPNHIVEKLDAVNVYDVAEKLGIAVSRNLALCFIHQDHHPSLHFKKSTNSWKCWLTRQSPWRSNQTPTIPDRKRTECPLPHAVGF